LPHIAAAAIWLGLDVVVAVLVFTVHLAQDPGHRRNGQWR